MTGKQVWRILWGLAALCMAVVPLVACRAQRVREPEQAAVVAAVGVDVAEHGAVCVTVEVLIVVEGTDGIERRLLSAKADDVASAYQSLLSGLPRAVLFGHCAVLVLGDGATDVLLSKLLQDPTLPPEMQVVTAPNAGTLLACEGISTPAMGYDIQAILGGERDVHCRVYELLADGKRVSMRTLPHFFPAPKESGRLVEWTLTGE